jgi:serine/threonine protein kinase
VVALATLTIDFGTAKLLRDPDGKVTQFALLTPRYASPEQLRGELVNTLSDVFSLGVILYEMLTGAWPFSDPKSTADAAERVLRGRGAGAPAQAVSEEAAAERSASRERLRRLRGQPESHTRQPLEAKAARRGTGATTRSLASRLRDAFSPGLSTRILKRSASAGTAAPTRRATPHAQMSPAAEGSSI